jgi:hypothetical protein
MPQNAPYPGETMQQFLARTQGGAPAGAMQSPLQAVPQAQGMPTQMPMDPSQMQGQMMDPELAETLLGTYGDQMEVGEMDKQMGRADALRSLEGGPEGRSSGRVYTAANPLEFIGKGMQQYAGKRIADRAERKGAKARKRIGENVKLYGKNLPE